MPSICELKIELKTRGVKGISGLNKAELESLLRRSKAEQKKEPPKPKPFVPAETKGKSPEVAEKQINKKIKVPKSFYVPYKPIKLPKSFYVPFKPK
jgi:hypothetical protein